MPMHKVTYSIYIDTKEHFLYMCILPKFTTELISLFSSIDKMADSEIRIRF